MSDNLRAAAQAALETLEDVFGKDKIDVSAINNLRAALVETQMPTKICGPNLVGMLNAAGFYQKKEWVGLTDDEKHDCYLKIDVWSRCVEAVESKLKEKNDD
ncbi:hypothetical protein UFOVP1109_4 [uncultured Caudovirales phage]|uniref:Uncharacterized protein n=1 Tax=uncultured Caudovirales phage TaxID=2100421 RepID=A0A6J5QHD1_9CAUD|nr:hypothetical protein UFOVP1109_4 [uncultured Caudovirales phage]CAB4216006.1 hypothetical protein UFOVP1473_43 [uncultured Caudovirales phage]CAB5230273.1 hypothetical protein UFOVP1560_51 [uncultured Caudovirales phage]